MSKFKAVPGVLGCTLTHLYVVVARDRKGEPRGFEKVSDGRFYGTFEDAQTAHAALPASLRPSFMVTRVLAQMEGSYSVSGFEQWLREQDLETSRKTEA